MVWRERNGGRISKNGVERGMEAGYLRVADLGLGDDERGREANDVVVCGLGEQPEVAQTQAHVPRGLV
jgi:hypothetical protein